MVALRTRIPAAALVVLLAACTSAPPVSPKAVAKPPTAPATMAQTPAKRPAPTAPPARSGPIVVHAVGDVNLDPKYVTGLADNGFAHAWTGLNGLFTTDDLTIVNLECPVARGGTRRVKRYTFLGAPDALPVMRAAGVDVAGLANNHTLDYGTQAMLETIRGLRAAGITSAGAGANAADAYRPAVRTVHGRRIAVVSLSSIIPSEGWPATSKRPGIASAKDVPAAVAAVRAAAKAADYVLVTIHWGIERVTKPNAEQRDLARRLIAAGADAIFGHHPHVLQPLEFHRGKPIFYSLGNFVWRRSWPASYKTGVAAVRFGDDGRIEAKLLPAVIESSGHPVLQ